ncbi:MAG: HNH endonuclease [Oceanicaulis sp.]
MGLNRRRFADYSRPVTRDRRWKALRLEALRRDKFACVKCGARGRLEVDHIAPVRDAPERAFDLANLQSLCGPCHARKTRIEAGHAPLSPERQAWRDLLDKDPSPC